MIPLTSTPNEARCVTDDTEAKLLLVEVGHLDKLLEHAKKAPSLSEPWSARIYCSNHPTHWLIADHFSGFANSTDNGFVVTCIPKSKCSWEQLRTMDRAMAAERFPNGIDYGEVGEIKPTRN